MRSDWAWRVYDFGVLFFGAVFSSRLSRDWLEFADSFRLNWFGDGVNSGCNFQIAIWETFGRTYQSGGDIDLLAFGKNQDLGCSILRSFSIHWRDSWSLAFVANLG